MIGTAVSHYLILGRLGAGGMAVVFDAQDIRLPRRVALKFLHEGLARNPIALTRFKREATALSLLNHPNICTIYEVDEFEGQPFIAMERLEGRTLRSRISEGPLKPHELLDVAIQMVQAFSAAHEKGIVHRDIKPGNIFLTPHGVKVLDFGLAKRLDTPDHGSTEETTAYGRPVGTSNYMSPEQIHQDELDPRSDLFSIGIVLFEMATTRTPFAGESVADTIGNILGHHPHSFAGLAPNYPTELHEIVHKLLSKDPAQRFQSADELLRRLKWVATRMDTASSEAPTTVAVGLPKPSVVVMPTKVFAGDADAFLADAIPNAISMHLLKSPGIETKRPLTAGDVERVAGDIVRIASVCGARSYVESSVNATGRRWMLTVQLVDTASHSLRWCDQYEGTKQTYAALVKRAAEGIRHALLPEEDRVITTTPLIANPDAELLLQRGLYHLNLFRNRGRPGDFERAAAFLRQSTELEPKRTDAAVATALLHNARIVTGAPTAEVVAECEKWARRALAIDPRSSKAWAILGEIESMGPDPIRKPLEYCLKAAAFGPQDAFAHTRLAGCFMTHSYELSLVAARAGTQLDPLVLDAPVFAAISANALGRTVEALSTIDGVLEIEPDMLFAQLVKGLILADSGATASALDIISKLEPLAAAGRLLPQWPRIFRDVATYNEAATADNIDVLDRVTASLARLARGEDPFPRWQVTTSGVPRLLAKRRPDLTLDLFATRALMGIIEPYDVLATHSDLDPLRSDVKFHRLLATSRRNFEGMIAIVRAAQSRNEAPGYIITALDDLVRRFNLRDAAS